MPTEGPTWNSHCYYYMVNELDFENKIKSLKENRKKEGLMKNISKLWFHLAWHDFTIDATDVDACIQAGLVMRINNVTPKRFVSAGRTVVWSLVRNKKHSTCLTTTWEYMFLEDFNY